MTLSSSRIVSVCQIGTERVNFWAKIWTLANKVENLAQIPKKPKSRIQWLAWVRILSFKLLKLVIR